MATQQISFKFFHFGCWNLFACEDGYPTENIIKDINSKNFEFGTLAGDNIYTHAKNKHKTIYNSEKMIDGIKCINKLNIPVYVALGNHDIDDDSCNMIDLQLGVHGNWYLPTNFYYKIKYNSIFFVIDTNILDVFDLTESKGNETYKCYGYGNNILVNKIKANFYEMLNMFTILDNNSFDNIFIMGHIPIITAKEKGKDQQSVKCSISNIKSFEQILDKLSANQNIKKIYYLCADTHNYQHITMKYGDMEIEQIIAGIGGAKQDHFNLCQEAANSMQQDLKDYITNDFIKHQNTKLKEIKLLNKSNNGEFGYIAINVNNNIVTHEFIGLGNDAQNTLYDAHGRVSKYKYGGYMMYMKHKARYLELNDNFA